MPATASIDLAADVELARRQPIPPPAPAVSLGLRLRTSPSVRRLMTRRVALARARRTGERRFADAEDRAHALAVMEAILAGTPRHGEAAALAPRRLLEEEAHTALFWEPWRVSRMDGASEAAVRGALAPGRPLLVSICHLGPYFLQFTPLPRFGIAPIIASGDWFFQPPEPGVWGRRIARWHRGIAGAGLRLMPAAGRFEAMRELLAIGEPVALYFDLPGATRTRFLGKTVDLASGSARLAHMTGAVVLPETLEDPTRAGAWEDGAGAEAWIRPGSR